MRKKGLYSMVALFSVIIMAVTFLGINQAAASIGSNKFAAKEAIARHVALTANTLCSTNHLVDVTTDVEFEEYIIHVKDGFVHVYDADIVTVSGSELLHTELELTHGKHKTDCIGAEAIIANPKKITYSKSETVLTIT